MQFKYPELLWALLLLAIPIIIHLFQLRKFKKTPFTNLKLLQRVVSESRKSSTLKKWLLLFTRLCLLAALVLAFAQPFMANSLALLEKENVFYLDNSFSMQAKNQGSTLLQELVQDFIKNVPEGEKFTLFTNDKVFANVSIQDVRNELLQLPVSPNQLDLDQIALTGITYFSNKPAAVRNLIVLSDFQKRMARVPLDSSQVANIYYVKPNIDALLNIAIDSVFLSVPKSDVVELTALLSANEWLETTPVSLYNGDKLIAKTAAKFNTGKKAEVRFSVPNNAAILGKVTVSDNGLDYDNQFYFKLDAPQKINVLAIGSAPHDYLAKIFGAPEFRFSNIALKELNYSSLEDYNLLILNEIESIPSGLSSALRSFTENGGHITIIPAMEADISTYNPLAAGYANTRYAPPLEQEILIDKVITDHPLFANVFEKSVSNFQYPKLTRYYPLTSAAPKALGLQNQQPFLLGKDNAYFFSAPLSAANTNFRNSPLIVPTFYNMGMGSLKLGALYSTLGQETTIEIPVSLSKDNILTLVKEAESFIPQQRLLPKKVQLSFLENPVSDGMYQIRNQDDILKHISFNYDRQESELLYTDLEGMPENRVHESVSQFFEETQRNNQIIEFWKWFAILALFFLLLETIFQKVLK